MSIKRHFQLFIYSFFTWFSFYIVGLPEYYQQWPMWSKLILLPLVTVIYFPVTRYTLANFWTDGRHLINSCWLALYLTLPLFIFDYLLLALYKELGIHFVIPYWYLTFFYFSFWIQLPYIGWKIDRDKVKG
jgi:hypothetical protein